MPQMVPVDQVVDLILLEAELRLSTVPLQEALVLELVLNPKHLVHQLPHDVPVTLALKLSRKLLLNHHHSQLRRHPS